MKRYISSLVLVVVNLLPIFGVFFFEWDILHVVLLYWFDLVILIIFSIIKMIVTGRQKKLPKVMSSNIVLALIFSIVLYAYLSIIFGFLGPKAENSDIDWPTFARLFNMSIPVISSFIISHGVSFFINFISRDEYKHTSVRTLLVNTLIKVGCVQGTMMLSLLIFEMIGSIGILTGIIVVKTFADLYAHAKEHNIPILFLKNKQSI